MAQTGWHEDFIWVSWQPESFVSDTANIGTNSESDNLRSKLAARSATNLSFVPVT